MQLWQDGLIALLASIGAAAILWSLVRPVLFVPPQQKNAVALISARGDGNDLEAQVRALVLLRGKHGVVSEILLVDCGLSEEGKALCRLLARQYRRVALITMDDIAKYVT